MTEALEEHRGYLADGVRLEAYRAAILQAVRPGDVVLDLASGTGILGLLACQAGASRVYSIESTGMIEVARAIAAANGVAERITFVHGLSTHVTLPEPVDVIVCDQIGHFGFEAGIIEYGGDARDRFLRPGGRFVPSNVDLFVAPVEEPALHEPIEFWRSRPVGFDVAAVRTWAVNQRYPATIAASALLGPGGQVASIDMGASSGNAFSARRNLHVERAGTLHGLAGWFAATLVPGVELSNAPAAPRRVKRCNAFLPIEHPTPVCVGDRLDVDLHVIPTDMLITWAVDVVRDGVKVGHARQSTLRGMLLSRADLQRTDPRTAPVLSPRGRARLSVLSLCDGRRSLAEIEREVQLRHVDVFPTVSEAAVFVGDVIASAARV